MRENVFKLKAALGVDSLVPFLAVQRIAAEQGEEGGERPCPSPATPHNPLYHPLSLFLSLPLSLTVGNSLS